MLKDSLIIIDDHALFAQCLARSIEPHFDFEITICTNAASGVGSVISIGPRVVLLDIDIAGDGGLQVFRNAAPFSPDTRWLVCTANLSPATLNKIITSGVHGVVLKRSNENELICAMREILQGRPYVSPEASLLVRESIYGKYASGLNEADAKLLQLLSDGLNSKEIGAIIGTSDRTVRERVQKLRNRLSVGGNAALVKCAIELGLLAY